MDEFEALQELQEESRVDTTIRRPLASAEGDNEITSQRSRTREVSSRYKSPTPSNNSRRHPSPNLTRTINPTSQLDSSKRALSAERKWPSSRPTSPSSRPLTPFSDTSGAEQQLSSSKKTGSSSRLPDVLWPSTMRSLSVSIQSDSTSAPVSTKEKEKPVTHAFADRTLKRSSNMTSIATRKSTPERKRSPFKGKAHHNQSENSRPVDGLQARLIDQHRWPSIAGSGRLSTVLTRSVDLSSDSFGTSSTCSPSSSPSSSPISISAIQLRRLSGEDVSDNIGNFSSSSSLSSTEIPLRRLSSEGVFDNVRRFSSSSSLSSTGIPSRRLSAEGVGSPSSHSPPGVSPRRQSSEGVTIGRSSSPSSLSTAGMSPRRPSSGGVSDNVGRFSNSSSLSHTSVPSRRLSIEGVSDNVGRFLSSSSLSSTGIPSTLSTKGVLQNIERFLSSSSLSSTEIPLSEGVSDNVERFSSSSSLTSMGIPLMGVSSECVLDNVGIFPSSSSLSSTGIPSRRLSADGIPRNLQKSSGDSSEKQSVFDEDHKAGGLPLKSVDDIFLREPKEDRLRSSRRASLGALPVRSRLMPGQRIPSPNRTLVSKGARSPLRTTLSAEGVPDNVERFSSSSSLSSTGIPSTRLSSEGVFDSARKFSSSSSLSSTIIPSRTLSAEGIPRNLQRSSGDSSGKQPVFEEDHRAGGLCFKSTDDIFLMEPKEDTLSSSRRASLGALPARSRLVPGQRPSSPNRTPVSKGARSPFRTRLSTEGVSDNFEKLSSSSISSTGTPSPRLSSEGVLDNVERFSSSLSLSSTGIPSRTLSNEGIPSNLQKRSSHSLGKQSVFEEDHGAGGLCLKSADDIFLMEPKEDTLSSSRRASLGALPARSRMVPGQRPSSPNRTPVSKGARSPFRTRLSTRGVSDNFEKVSSSSSISSTGTPSPRLSSKGVLDNVEIFSSSSSLSSTGMPSRRLSNEGIPRNLQKSFGDSSGKHLVFEEDHRASGLCLKSADDIFLMEPKEDTLSSSRRASLGALPARSRMGPGQRPSSPNKTPVSKGARSPFRTRLSTEGVSDNFEKVSSSSSISSTGTPSPRLSSKGVLYNVEIFSSSSSLTNTGMPSRRLSNEGIPRNLQKSSGDSSRKQPVFEEGHRAGGLCLKSADDIFLMEPNEDTLSSSRRASLGAFPARSRLVPGQRPSSPNRTPVSKGARSPFRTRLSTQGVSDKFEKLSSSSISSTGTPSPRLSSKGVLDNVEIFSSSSSLSSTGIPSKRLSNQGIWRNLEKTSGDSSENHLVFEEDHRAGGLCLKSADDIFLMEPKEDTLSSSRRASLGALPVRSRLVPGQRLPSPNRTPVSKGALSPLRTRLSAGGVSDDEKFSSSSPFSNTGTPSKRMSAEGIPRNLQKSSGDFSGKQSVVDEDLSAGGLCLKSVDDSFLKEQKEDTLSSSRRASLGALPVRSRLLPGQRLSSPNKTLVSERASSPLRTTLAAEGISDNFERFSSSSSPSSTGTPSTRLSSEGIFDSVERFSSSSSLSSAGIPSRRLSTEGIPRNLQKNSEDDRAGGLHLKSADDIFVQELKEDTSSSSRRASLGALPARSRLVPAQRLPSPIRTTVSKGAPSPLRIRPSTPTSRGASPSRVRPSSPTKQSTSANSVFSFIPDIMNCKKTSQLLEDAHQLRLLHNRYLQWRFTNAQADAAMYFKKINAEENLYNVWQTNLQLWDSVITKRIELQQMKLELKVNLMLRDQFSYLEDWTLHEREHCASLVGAITAFKASTLRVPIIGGAKADIDSLMAAMGSAVNVMHTTVSSIYYVLPKVEDMNGWVSELAELAGHEKASLNECDALLTSTATMQVREYSLRAQQIQSEQDFRSTTNPISSWPTTF